MVPVRVNLEVPAQADLVPPALLVRVVRALLAVDCLQAVHLARADLALPVRVDPALLAADSPRAARLALPAQVDLVLLAVD